MQHTFKCELVKLLNEFKQELPPAEERKHLTNHYAALEKRIADARRKLMDADYDHVRAVNRKLLQLQMEGRISMDECQDLYRKETD